MWRWFAILVASISFVAGCYCGKAFGLGYNYTLTTSGKTFDFSRAITFDYYGSGALVAAAATDGVQEYVAFLDPNGSIVWEGAMCTFSVCIGQIPQDHSDLAMSNWYFDLMTNGTAVVVAVLMYAQDGMPYDIISLDEPGWSIPILGTPQPTGTVLPVTADDIVASIIWSDVINALGYVLLFSLTVVFCIWIYRTVRKLTGRKA